MTAAGCARCAGRSASQQHCMGSTGFQRTACRPSFVLLREKPGRTRWWTREIHALPGLGSPVVCVTVVSRNFVDASSICMQCERVAAAMMHAALSRGKAKADGMPKRGPTRPWGWTEQGRKRCGRRRVAGPGSTCTVLRTHAQPIWGFRSGGLDRRRWTTARTSRGTVSTVAAHKGQNQTHRR